MKNKNKEQTLNDGTTIKSSLLSFINLINNIEERGNTKIIMLIANKDKEDLNNKDNIKIEDLYNSQNEIKIFLPKVN
jgi:hypothetical protein